MSFVSPALSTSLDDALTSAIVSDSLDACGFRDQVLPTGIHSLVEGSRILGRARTVHFAPSDARADEKRPYNAVITFIDSLNAGDVVVIATDANPSAAYWGELFSAAAIGHGALGVITDGQVRDVAKIRTLGFPVFSRGRRPIDFRARMHIVASDERVALDGVKVDLGDLVIADDDGVVVIPRSHEVEVLATARERARAESTVLAELLAGSRLRDVWDTYSVL